MGEGVAAVVVRRRSEQINQAGTDNLKLMNCVMPYSSGTRPKALPDWHQASPYLKRMCRYKSLIFSRLSPFFLVFHPISQLQGFDFSPVAEKTRDKRFRGWKMKCHVNTNRSLIGNSGSHEFGGAEIFQSKQACKMKEGFRDSSPRLLPFQQCEDWRRKRRGHGVGEIHTIKHNKTR